MFTFLGLVFQSRVALIAENLFLREQLALFVERKVRPARTTRLCRSAILVLSKFFDWRNALVIVKPETFLKWHRQAFRAFWRGKCKLGRPTTPKGIRELVRRMADENPSWGAAHIANELQLKLGLSVWRTVAKYLKADRPRSGNGGQRWSAFVKNHAKAIVACDFFQSVTWDFKVLYVFVAMEIGSRRIT